MKKINYLMFLVFGLLTGLPLQAARISEPGSTFYGRVITRVGELEFPITEGQLKWTISVPAQNNREYTFTSSLQSIGGGIYAYKLTIPHQVLAYNLTVSSNQIPLTTAGWRIRHLRVQIDGEEATLSAPAVDEFTARQASRASTYRIDLVLNKSSLDSDGDGLPDWWEDKNGLDKWNPDDGKVPIPGGPGTGGGSNSFTGHTFAEWRQFYFPGSTGSLEAFSQEDPDQDGVSNLFEYAFKLDPKNANDEKAIRLPRPYTADNRIGILFNKQNQAADLEYQVEVSQDLMQWSSDAEVVETLALSESPADQSCVCAKSAEGDGSTIFLRVRVNLKP